MLNEHRCRIPVSKLALPSNEVHIWHASVEVSETCLKRLIIFLSEDEVKRSNRFHFERDRKRFIVAHGLLRHILSCYCVSDPDEHSFRRNRYGKPALASDDNIRFSMSHSGERVLYGITRGREIGVDIERLRPFEDIEQIVENYFSSREKSEFSTLPDYMENKSFFTCWTRKEAYTKAQGKGMSLPLNQFSVSFLPGGPVRLTETLHSIKEKNHWSLREIVVNAEYAAAVAVEGHGLLYRNWQWSW